uniref:Uncharacterized protein n=1 Tax=Sinocyclocheilus grahami TaxID=75366 RepID=A0A672P693_SINGR
QYCNALLLKVTFPNTESIYLVKQRRPRGFPPGPTPLPMIGHILSLATEPHAMYNMYNSLYRISHPVL